MHNEVQYLEEYMSLNVIPGIISRMTWVGHVARIVELYVGFWKGNLREKTTWKTLA
jgi:hypothetical protein